ncbi:MAG: TolC family protein [Phormidesmis sp.]
MRYLKSAAFLLLMMGSSVSLLQAAIAAPSKQVDLSLPAEQSEKQLEKQQPQTPADSLPTLEDAEPADVPAQESTEPETVEPDQPSAEEVLPTDSPAAEEGSTPEDTLPTPAEPEIGELPDILFADPNPLTVPTVPEEVDVERNPVITLEQAVDLAYRNSQALQAALLTLEQSEAAVAEVRAGYLPTVTAGADLTTRESNGSTIPGLGQVGDSTVDTTLGGSLDLSYDVLTGGSRAASLRAAEFQRQANALAVEVQQEQIRLDTSNLYYTLQDAGEQIRINQSFLEEAERNLRDSRLRQEVGVGTRFDTLRAEVQFANARQSLIQSQSQQRIARRNIARLLNLPPTSGIEATPVAVAENWPLTLEDSIILAFQNRAELEQQLLQADISEQQRRIALAAIRPQVSLFANYSVQGQIDNGDSFQDNYSFGARFNMRLFDGGAARASARQQEIGGAIAEEQFSQSLDEIRFDVEEAYFNLQANQENIATSEVAVAQAQEALDLANLRLEAGVGTQLDVLTAQSELTQAQANNVSAILGYNRALAAIERAVSNLGLLGL